MNSINYVTKRYLVSLSVRASDLMHRTELLFNERSNV